MLECPRQSKKGQMSSNKTASYKVKRLIEK